MELYYGMVPVRKILGTPGKPRSPLGPPGISGTPLGPPQDTPGAAQGPPWTTKTAMSHYIYSTKSSRLLHANPFVATHRAKDSPGLLHGVYVKTESVLVGHRAKPGGPKVSGGGGRPKGPGGPQGPMGPIRAHGAHKGPAHKCPWGPTSAWGAHKGPAHKGPGGPTSKQGGPQGPGGPTKTQACPQWPIGGVAHKGAAHKGLGKPTRAQGVPREPRVTHKGPGGAHKGQCARGARA